MKVYTVIPIARGIGKETLSYFGPDNIAIGSLVSIPLRKKTSHAIVIDSSDITASKADIKSSRFSLKKIGKVVNASFLSAALLKATNETSNYYATTTGAVLQSVVPKIILENANKIVYKKRDITKKARREFSVAQDTDIDRFAHYKSFIRGEFAKHSSVYFCLPTIEDIRHAKLALEKGIEKYTVVLNSRMTKKEFTNALKTVLEEEHPILIIGTAPFLSIERSDLGSIILDRENSRSYRTFSRPYLDMRTFVKNFANALGVRLILGDLLLSVETLWHQKNEAYSELASIKSRVLTSAENLLVDMKLPKGEFAEKFNLLSPELEALIDKTKEGNENLFIFCARKGLAPITVCGDCGTVVTCQRCNAPITLYRRKNENIFLCNKCGDERETTERCKNCDSWKLETLGIGAEGVAEEIKKRFPEVTVFRMDKDSVETPKKALQIIEKFEATPGSVLVGTELALLYLSKSIENIAVASMDALFSISDFRISEKIFYLLLAMRARANKVFLIQTRNANEKLFDYALKGNLTDFYRQEIDERKKFNYPPFAVFIKLTLEGKRSAVDKEIEELLEYFKDWNPAAFESINNSSRGNPVMNILFRFIPSSWPDENFLKKVRTLPPQIMVHVDPESLLS